MADSSFFRNNPTPTALASLNTLVTQALADLAAAEATLAAATQSAQDAALSATAVGATLAGSSQRANNLADLYDPGEALSNIGAAAAGINSDINELNSLVTLNNGALPIRGYLSGCNTAYVSASTISVAAGVVASDDGTILMKLPTLLQKTTASWVAGANLGGLDTGTITNGTWYHVYVIMNPLTRVVDVLISTSASSPTLPTNFTKKRRVGSFRYGAAAVVQFTQLGDEFLFTGGPSADFGSVLTTTASTVTLFVPPGVQVRAICFHGAKNTAATATNLLISPLDCTDIAVTVNNATAVTGAVAGMVQGSMVLIRTNTSQQVRYRCDQASGVTGYINTFGWLDTRGRDL